MRLTFFYLLLSCILLTQAQVFSLNQEGVEYNFFNSEKELFERAESLSYEEILRLCLIVENQGGKEDVSRTMAYFNAFIKKNSKIAKINNQDKKIKKLIDVFQTQFVKDISATINVEDAILLGSYNGYTNALLLSVILEAYNIPFEIKASSETFYVYPYPESSNLCINYFSEFPFELNENNELYREQYIDRLRAFEYILDEEYLSHTEAELFKKYHDFDGGEIDKLRLLANFYAFRSIQLFNNEEYQSGYDEIKKACKLSPLSHNLTLRNEIAYNYLDVFEYKKVEDVHFFIEVANYNPRYIEKVMISHQAIQMFEKFAERNHADFEECCSIMIKNLPTDSLKDHARLILYDQKAINFKHLAFPDSCYFYREKAYALSERTPEYQIDLYNDWIQSLTGDIAGTELEYIALLEKYPELNDNPYFQMVSMNILLVKAGRYVSLNQYATAEKLITQFEREFENYKGGLLPLQENVVNSYGRLAVYYYSTNRTSTAKEVVDKALIYAPDNYDLLRRKAMITGGRF